MNIIQHAQTIDLAIFAGQSNMSGRGDAKTAIHCPPDAGFEYKAISNPTTLLPITEPFGLGEDRPGAISDYDSKGRSKRTGSMVSAAVSEYYALTGRPLIAVSASIGGSNTSGWLKVYVNDAVERLDTAKEFLAKEQITPGKIFLIWCQGESDGDAKMTASAYITNTKAIFHAFQSHGVEKCFMVQIGHYNYLQFPQLNRGLTGRDWDLQYKIIRDAQAELCRTEKDFILAGSFEPHMSHMKDAFHYHQTAYNIVGQSVGASMGQFVTSCPSTPSGQ